MVLPNELDVNKSYKDVDPATRQELLFGKFTKKVTEGWFPRRVTLYEFVMTPSPGPDGKSKGLTVDKLKNVVEDSAGSSSEGPSGLISRAIAVNTAPPAAGRRRRTHRMMFKKWAAQEAREMSHKGKRMTFRKWAANELKEKSHPGNPSFKKWARQEMREKSHTRRRR